MFIDIHAHAYRTASPPSAPVFSTPAQVLKRYDELQIEKGVLLPLVSPEVYLPQSNEDILDMARASNGRFIPFCNIDPRALSNSADAPLGDLLCYYRDQGCKGIGEVMPNLPFLHPLMLNLFRHVAAVGLPLIFDMSTRLGAGYGLYDDPGLPQLEACLRGFAKLTFLGHGPPFWAEIGTLDTPADRAVYPEYPVREEGVVPKLFRRYPNLHGDLSAGSGYNALARDPDYAARFINEFQDRLMFGTDICAPEQAIQLPAFLLQLKREGKISEEVFGKVARQNAVRLLSLE